MRRVTERQARVGDLNRLRTTAASHEALVGSGGGPLLHTSRPLIQWGRRSTRPPLKE